MEGDLHILISRPDGEGEMNSEMPIDIARAASVMQLKEKIEEFDPNLNVPRQRLIWGGRQLADAEILENVFKRSLADEEALRVRLTMRRYGAFSPCSTPLSPAKPAPPVVPTPIANPTPAAPAENAPADTPVVPVTISVTPAQRAATKRSAAARMNNHLMNKAYWNAAAEYGSIMTQAAQLGYQVPFGDTLFNPAPPPTAPAPAAPGPAGAQNPMVPPQNNLQNAEDAEIARQIAAAEAPAFERHFKLALKLAFFVLLLHQDGSSPERFAMLCLVAVGIFVVQTGWLDTALAYTGVTRLFGMVRRGGDGNQAQEPAVIDPANVGWLWEIQLFVHSFFATLIPGGCSNPSCKQKAFS